MSTRILDLTMPTAPGVGPATRADPRTTNPLVEQAWRDKLVRDAAYFRYEQRQPGPGRELDDWLAAEQEVDQSLGRLNG